MLPKTIEIQKKKKKKPNYQEETICQIKAKELREIGNCNRARLKLYDSIAWKKHAVDGIANGSRVNSIALAGLIVLRSRWRFEKPKDELAWKQGVPIRLQPLVLTGL